MESESRQKTQPSTEIICPPKSEGAMSQVSDSDTVLLGSPSSSPVWERSDVALWSSAELVPALISSPTHPAQTDEYFSLLLLSSVPANPTPW